MYESDIFFIKKITTARKLDFPYVGMSPNVCHAVLVCWINNDTQRCYYCFQPVTMEVQNRLFMLWGHDFEIFKSLDDALLFDSF